jgi:hypothetical protein
MSTEHRLISTYRGRIVPQMVAIDEQPYLPFVFVVSVMAGVALFSAIAYCVGY